MAKYLVCMDFSLTKLEGMERDYLQFEVETKEDNPTDAYQKAFAGFLKWKGESGYLEEGIKSNDFEGAETAFIHPFKMGKKRYKQCLGLVFSQEKLDGMNDDTKEQWIADVVEKLVDEAKEMNA